MSHLPRDPWVDVKTVHGFAADHVISALQKEIRRGHAENAVLLAYEMCSTSPALEDYLWQRLKIIAVEDVGFGEPMAPVLINALWQMLQTFDRAVGERKLFAVHAVRYLCGCQKDRSSDEMINWFIYATENEGLRPEIPDYAIDMHTHDGQAKGRGRRQFWQEGAQVAPEKADRDRSYRERILALLGEGKLED
jgi:replication-associated recombination protein RarA